MPVRTLDSILSRDQNNFDLVRMIAALAVIFGHAFSLHPTGGAVEPLNKVFGFTYSGAVAVDVFFFLSGLLITGSFCQSRSVFRFVVMRVARIWPGLLACLCMTVFVLGPLITSMPLWHYITSWHTREYMLRNVLLQNISYTLPGVFISNHYPGAVNGSLWTLPIEIRCYAMVLLMGCLGVFKTKQRCLLVVMGLTLLLWPTGFGPAPEIFKLNASGEEKMPLLFALGMVCYVCRHSIRIDARLSGAALLVALSMQGTWLGIAAFYCFVVNTVLVLSAWKALRVRLPGDYSYGIYIYGFVAQQYLAHALPELKAYPSLLISIPMTCALAALSWHAVEKPGMRLGRMLADWRERGRTVADAA
ncbi:acyltransferase family protein [Paucibacter sp. Y2R2-4]|uniref:acyltransferase family protein n=1 Tax=Paucibacter sp. Y2R2-4 TaxID=2893553 RepID=UPI0021E454FC|nr:acyltransferase [Paucibacter sp. Y2R2-4]MCV2351394.1 acyltransferase [Paucibacter sp. Y2R2-4]